MLWLAPTLRAAGGGVAPQFALQELFRNCRDRRPCHAGCRQIHPAPCRLPPTELERLESKGERRLLPAGLRHDIS